jgi:hypothetical protein
MVIYNSNGKPRFEVDPEILYAIMIGALIVLIALAVKQ